MNAPTPYHKMLRQAAFDATMQHWGMNESVAADQEWASAFVDLFMEYVAERIDPSALVLVRDADGNWPEVALASLADPPLYELADKDIALLEMAGRKQLPTKPRYILDALAEAAKENPQ